MTARTVGARYPSPGQIPEDSGYREFYAHYRNALLCYVRMAFPGVDAEAVTQDAFCRALDHWAEIGQRENLWPWLAMTARNLACNNLRDERNSRAAGLEVLNPSRNSGVDVADQVDATDQLRLLAKAMEVLTPFQRQLLTVMIEEGLNGAEVARRLGMQPGAVRMQLCRLRALLSARFTDLGGQLVLLPIVATLIARLRRRGGGLQQVVLTTGTTAFALSVTVLAIGLGPSGLGLGPRPADAATQPALAPVDPTWGRAETPAIGSVAHPSRGRVTDQQVVAPPVSYHVELSKTPTRPGETADIRVEVQTPVGTLYVEVPVTMQSPDPQSTCPAGVGC